MPFGSLWLPVVVSAVAVWLVSAVLHMVLKYHRADHRQLQNEDAVAPALRGAVPGPGVYMMPWCSDPSQMKDPAVRKRYEDGPVAILTVMRSGVPNMGKYLGMWFLVCLLVSFVTSYVARHSLDPGAVGLEVLRLTGTIAFIGYGFGYFQDSIWKGIPWSNSLRGILDAAVYAVVTGLVFRFLWPAV
jgi:hypothetical protein